LVPENIADDTSDSEPDDVEFEKEISDTCSDDESNDDNDGTCNDSQKFMSKDSKIAWSKAAYPNAHGRRSQSNIVREKRGLAASIGDLSSPVEALNCFLDEDFYSRVTNHTNQELVRVIAKMTYEDKHNYREFSVDETRAAVGLLLLAGVTSARRESLEQLWDEKRGRSIFRATMSCTRFKVFLLAARFDDKASRPTRRETDKLAPIRELFDSFVSKCKQLYTMSPFVCVDECLLGFRGRCSFRVYMPSKPAKYGLKVWMLCDVGTSFAGNLQVYLGKESTGLPEKGQGARVVKDLCGYIFNSGRNVTTDNFFTSYSLSQELLTKNLTLLGTMRQNRPELPPAMLPKKREQYDSIFGFTNDAMLVSYAPRRNRTVAVLSTMHDSIEVDTLTEEKKPYAILDYNSTKGAVDSFDQQIAYYSCARKTNRWPMRLFYFLLDTASYNAFVAFSLKNPTCTVRKISVHLRKKFRQRFCRNNFG
jgi:hypothetical protein